MNLRAVVSSAHRGEQVLSRRVDPHGPGFLVFLMLRLVDALHREEGPRRSHWVVAASAVLLMRMGVAGEAAMPGEELMLADTTHADEPLVAAPGRTGSQRAGTRG